MPAGGPDAKNRDTTKVTLFIAIDPDRHEKVRELAFKKKESFAMLIEEALDLLIKKG